MKCQSNILHINLPVEGNSHGTQENPGVLVILGGGVKGNVTARNHLGRVPSNTLEPRRIKPSQHEKLTYRS